MIKYQGKNEIQSSEDHFLKANRVIMIENISVILSDEKQEFKVKYVSLIKLYSFSQGIFFFHCIFFWQYSILRRVLK
jgi:hypothetical protein